MRVQPTTLILITTATFLWAGSAYAKRAAPKLVPPVVWQGVEYRAPLDVEHIGHVQAFDLSSGRELWETTVYHVPINPLVEEDVQWVFISEMQVQDGKLVIMNERRKTYRLDLKTGRVEGAMLYWMAVFLVAVVLLLGVFAVWRRAASGQQKPAK
jgi:outer membrane protein assembly factor BamB